MVEHISIHALREEGDALFPVLFDFYVQFLSTPSARRATRKAKVPQHRGTENFYPRPPRGGRPNCRHCRRSGFRFLSTPSARRATVAIGYTVVKAIISIHALREEGDQVKGQAVRP